MKILFVSDNAINGFGGGSIENRKHYDALREYCKKNGDELKVISRDGNLEESLNVNIYKNKIIDILVRFKGHSTYLYNTWKHNEKLICSTYKPDILYLGRSRFGFIAKRVKKLLPECHVITNIDNVEIDYIDGYFSMKKGLVNKFYRMLETWAVKRDETQAVKCSDVLIYLTKRNVARIEEIYGHYEGDPIVLPICIKEEITLRNTANKKNIVFVGSLDYAANVLAVQRILKLWKKKYLLNESIQLIIAGRNPSKELIEDIGNLKNVTLVQNFEDISTVIPKKSLMLAPIEKGAGMKVKVAETLSMGLMIAASDEALVGYEEAEIQDHVGGIIRANTEKEFEDCIDCFLGKTEDELSKIEKSNKMIYRICYSYKKSRTIISNVCDNIRNNLMA